MLSERVPSEKAGTGFASVQATKEESRPGGQFEQKSSWCRFPPLIFSLNLRSPELNDSPLANSYFTLAAAAIGLVAVSALIVFVFRSLFGPRLRLPRNGRTRPVRLAIVDAFNVDHKRQLVIVRRDNIEHLLMIGGPNDLVIESQFVRSESREQRIYRDAKFRDKEPREKELRETPLVATLTSPMEADLPLSPSHKAPPPPAAAAARDTLPLELLEGVEQKWEPVLRPDSRENRDLKQNGDARKSHLDNAQRLRANGPAFVLPTARSSPPSIKERRGPLESASQQRTPTKGESAPSPAGPPQQQEAPTIPAARAPLSPVATTFQRPSTRRQVQETGSQSARSRAPEPRARGDAPLPAAPKSPEVFAEPKNAEAAEAARAALLSSADAAACGFGGTSAAAAENDKPRRGDLLELEISRLLGREPLVKA
jgi:flagellar protein FliO/FliZ